MSSSFRIPPDTFRPEEVDLAVLFQSLATESPIAAVTPVELAPIVIYAFRRLRNFVSSVLRPAAINDLDALNRFSIRPPSG